MAVVENRNKRFPNFTEAERQLLIKVSVKYKNIIECKKTDAVTWREKLEFWDKIAKDFNAASPAHYRSAKQLKNKYEAVKKDIRKKHSQNKIYMRGTGGGPYLPPITPINEEEKILTETIIISVEGLENHFDSDAVAGTSGISIQNTPMDEDDEETEIEANWENPSAVLWQTPKHHLLKLNADLSSDVEKCQTENADELAIPNTKECKGNEEGDTQVKAKPIVQTKKWHSRRTPVLPKKRNVTSVSGKFEQVAESRLQLLQLQKEAVKKKMEQDQVEHDKNLEVIELKKTEQLLKIEILKKQLKN